MNKIVDLSIPLTENIPIFPSGLHPSFTISKTATIEKNGRNISKIQIGSHCGTHIDAPSHFIRNGKTIDQIPLTYLIGEAYLIHVGELPPGSVITSSIIDSLLPKQRKVIKLLIRTNWSRFLGKKQYYIDWPTLTNECCNYLINRGIKLLGLDFPSPDKTYDGTGTDSPNHKLLFKNKVILIEYLINLNKLKTGKIFIISLPLNLTGVDGCPARTIAWNI